MSVRPSDSQNSDPSSDKELGSKKSGASESASSVELIGGDPVKPWRRTRGSVPLRVQPSRTSAKKVEIATAPPKGGVKRGPPSASMSKALRKQKRLAGPLGCLEKECQFTAKMANKILRTGAVPHGWRIRIPKPDEVACNPAPGEMTFYKSAFDFVRLPLPPFIVDILNFFSLSPGQLAPNGWAMIVSFFVYAWEKGVPPSVNLFRHFFFCKGAPSGKGWFYFSARPSKTIFSYIRTSTKGWYPYYFFISGPEEWGVPRNWVEDIPTEVNEPPVLSEEEAGRVKSLEIRPGGRLPPQGGYLDWGKIWSCGLMGKSPPKVPVEHSGILSEGEGEEDSQSVTMPRDSDSSGGYNQEGEVTRPEEGQSWESENFISTFPPLCYSC